MKTWGNVKRKLFSKMKIIENHSSAQMSMEIRMNLRNDWEQLLKRLILCYECKLQICIFKAK